MYSGKTSPQKSMSSNMPVYIWQVLLSIARILNVKARASLRQWSTDFHKEMQVSLYSAKIIFYSLYFCFTCSFFSMFEHDPNFANYPADASTSENQSCQCQVYFWSSLAFHNTNYLFRLNTNQFYIQS